MRDERHGTPGYRHVGTHRRALALGVVLAIAGSAPVRSQCPDGSPPPCARAVRPAGPPPTSVAVLYFDNLSRDTADSYLAEGLTEQTIAQLGEVERLTVASRFAVRRFRGSEVQDPAAVGRALNVSYLVTGSVQRAGTRLRVGVELVRASSGVRVWGERYDRTETDLLRLQDEIASAVATGIVGRLLPAERSGLAVRRTRNPAAWDRFLRGNFFLARREAGMTQRAIAEYQAALQADPGFTDALARIAYAYGLALDADYDLGLPRDTLVARGVAMAERALRLDSTSSDAWMARAYVRMGEEPRTMAGAGDLFERAIRMNPRNAEAHHQYAQYLHYMGDTAAAYAENRRALEIEPGRAITWNQLTALALQRGDYREMLRCVDSALAADPGFSVGRAQRVYGLIGLGDTAAARRAVAAMPGDIAYIGQFLTAVIDAQGQPDPSAAIMGFVASAQNVQPSPTLPGNVIANAYIAMLLVRLGARDIALQLLELARPRGARLHSVMRYAPFDPIRADQRFQAVFNDSRPPDAR
jgi:adenylate cyclase